MWPNWGYSTSRSLNESVTLRRCDHCINAEERTSSIVDRDAEGNAPVAAFPVTHYVQDRLVRRNF